MHEKIPKHIIKSRIRKIHEAMKKQGIESLVLTEPENVQYVTGFNVIGNPPKSAWAIIINGLEEAYLLVPPLEYYEAVEEAENTNVIKLSREIRALEAVSDFIAKREIPKPIALDNPRHLLIDFLKRRACVDEIKDLSDDILLIRSVKDEYEVACMKRAIEIAKVGLERAYEILREGVKETTVVAEIEKELWEMDIDGLAFDIIVASGPRSSFPHAKPTSRTIRSGESVIVDLGVRVRGYCSDLTRTYIIGRNPEIEHSLNVINEVQEKVIKEVKENMRASMLDMMASKLIKEKNFGEHILHGVGHGIGLSVHEKPILSPFSDDTLIKGNVITIEPGIYVRGRYGVRVEDIVLINSNAIKLS